MKMEMKVSTVFTVLGVVSFAVAYGLSHVVFSPQWRDGAAVVGLIATFALLPWCSLVGGILALVNLMRLRRWQFAIEAIVAITTFGAFLAVELL